MSFEVKFYSVQLGRTMRRHADTGEEFWYDASILCKPKKGACGQYLSIFFLPAGELLPPNEVVPIGASFTHYYATIYARTDEYPHFIDLLRNEKPLTAAVVMGKPSLNRLVCREDEAGEAELELLTGLDPKAHLHG
ncbi:MAG: hypothetical protein HY900_11515 [Deltaproteobacteria bacterium]|nr:hypothetical protein [Deltaproteobacteria bacterium]